jgi:hypothetical protein
MKKWSVPGVVVIAGLSVAVTLLTIGYIAMNKLNEKTYDLEEALAIKTSEPHIGYVVKKTWEKGCWLLQVNRRPPKEVKANVVYTSVEEWIEVPYEVFQFAESGQAVKWTVEHNQFNRVKTRLVFLSSRIRE